MLFNTILLMPRCCRCQVKFYSVYSDFSRGRKCDGQTDGQTLLW